MKIQLPFYLSIAYIVLLFLQIPVIAGGGVLAADVGFIALAVSLLPQWRPRSRNMLSDRGLFWLVAFLGLATLATLLHGGIYNLAVFAYMAAIYIVFSEPMLNQREAFFLGMFLLGTLLAAYCVAWVWRFFSANPACDAAGLFYIDRYLTPDRHGILGARFQCLFNNPNLLGSFYILPVALCFGTLKAKVMPRLTTLPRLLLALAATLVILLPLLSTVSKHAVATFALAALLFAEAPVLKNWRPRLLGWAVILAFGLVAILTTTYRISPVRSQFPFINTSLPANYAIHRAIYAKICVNSAMGALFGHSPEELHRLYPTFADRTLIAKVMESYGSEPLVEPFSTFMDPHIEYLNLPAFFGIPAMLCWLAFWLSRIFQGGISRNEAAMFVVAILLCCCWDDLMSKRWVWTAAAIFFANKQTRNCSS